MTEPIRLTRRYDAPPERVFDAWVNPEKVKAWMGAPAAKMTGQPDEVLRITTDPRVGGKFSFVVRRQGQELDHAGEYLEVDRPRRLVFTWGVPAFSADFSVVALDFVPDGDGTLLTLDAGQVPEAYRERTAAGWGHIMASLAV